MHSILLLSFTLLFATSSGPFESASPATTGPASSARKSGEKFEAVQFKTEDKLQLGARFYASRKKGRAPAVLLVHDAGSDALSLASVAEHLQRKGFAVLAMDLRGHGESVSDACDWAKLDEDGKTQSWAFATRDLEAGTQYLRGLDTVHSSNLSLVGVGAGGVLASRYATKDENARAVVVVEPDPKAFGYEMGADITELGGLPVLFLASKKTREVAIKLQSETIAANDGYECVDVSTIKPKVEGDVFSDSRLPGLIGTFLQDQAMKKQ